MDKSNSTQLGKRPRVTLGGSRGAENVFSPLAPQRIYLHVESVEEESIFDLSPFRLHKEIKNVMKEDIKMSKAGRRILLEVDTKMDEERLMRVSELAGMRVKVARDGYLNTSRGVVKDRDFKECESEEFLEYVPSVINARRIEIRRGDRKIKTNTFVLTFNTPTPPQEIKAGYMPLTVRPYVPTPMRCFRCHRYGHGRNKSRAKEELCVRCGEPGHGSEECKRDVRCVNCKGDYPEKFENMYKIPGGAGHPSLQGQQLGHL
ncbi:RNA-directed DNA polymerase from mobile element jockey [Elysia marginata]|uniref:RNA-directed DNA polymerase from mobile element jockey n=1 Tax=Elysia marginata TaxID=1093978 RepID=A0AAV4JNM3_9GAST|nr:RNA-directed DNA polymerase from mobile element jockey [Elysia marginata]